MPKERKLFQKSLIENAAVQIYQGSAFTCRHVFDVQRFRCQKAVTFYEFPTRLVQEVTMFMADFETYFADFV